MNINRRQLAIPTVCGPVKRRIDTRPDYQRPLVWTKSQKQLLIDTILRGYDVPKLYWRRVGKNPDRYEVVDGQQRLHAIWDFCDGNYSLAEDADPIDGHRVAGLGYADLPDDVRSKLDEYQLDIVILEDTEEEEAREMFLRLQSGTTLRAAEKRNARPGLLRDLVHELAQHPFFLACGFANRRFDFDQVAAQMMLLELNRGPYDIGDHELTKAYVEYADFDFQRGQGKRIAAKIQRVLGFLASAFPEKTPELKKTSVVSLYLLVSTLMETHVVAGMEKEVANWFIGFERRRSEEEEKPQDERDPDMVAYHAHMTSGTNSQDSISLRHEILSRTFMLSFPDLARLDNQREFSFEQRLAIFRKDRGVCQWIGPDGTNCGVRCTWSDWHADHIVPWSKGGQTTVTNGQVLCPRHNLSKGSSLPTADESIEGEASASSVEHPRDTVAPTPRGSLRSVSESRYGALLNKLCDLGWKPEPTPGQGRTVYSLDPGGSVIGIFRHAVKQNKGRISFYFFGITPALLGQYRSPSALYVFLECDGPESVLVMPGAHLERFMRETPTVGSSSEWKINVFSDGTDWWIKPSGQPRVDVTGYLNCYPISRPVI